jgi:hypothetical protein
MNVAASRRAFKMATKFIYFYCTQLVSTTDDHHHVSKHDVYLAIYFGGPRPQVLGIDHAFGACRELSSVLEVQDDGLDLRTEASKGLPLGLDYNI